MWCDVFAHRHAGSGHVVDSIINLVTAPQASWRGKTPSSPISRDTDAHGKDQPGKKGLIQQWKDERVVRTCKVLSSTLKSLARESFTDYACGGGGSLLKGGRHREQGGHLDADGRRHEEEKEEEEEALARSTICGLIQVEASPQ